MSDSIRRVASVIGLPPEHRAEYERLHAAVWPSVLEQIARSNIRNYSIYRHGDLLFSYFEYVGTSYEADMAAMGADPATREWWALTEPLQAPLPMRDPANWWATLPEVFHTD
ncbi:L-rhamnose mutarotase [Mycetocola sp. BIGb0189]|uniref:L-rhamnose mutarotase n=1 Tax=Mycetocola sp. BIGb0189 TaxID=2940604 RepID=UPI002168482D|nr:L-rhamnose mutarotase [Mycetocola sp. BIGb0189]MCS4277108.1 L-rhamnose mutarotase [Mycetocola sp. BIGb0189]